MKLQAATKRLKSRPAITGWCGTCAFSVRPDSSRVLGTLQSYYPNTLEHEGAPGG